MVLARATTPDDWQAMLEIRLQALQDAPDAFASTYAKEAAFTPAEWRRRASRDGTFLAYVDNGELAGLAGDFTATAERQPLPSNPDLGELGMSRPLLNEDAVTRTR